MVGFERIYGHRAVLIRAILARMSDPNKLPLQRFAVRLNRDATGTLALAKKLSVRRACIEGFVGQ